MMKTTNSMDKSKIEDCRYFLTYWDLDEDYDNDYTACKLCITCESGHEGRYHIGVVTIVLFTP